MARSLLQQSNINLAPLGFPSFPTVVFRPGSIPENNIYNNWTSAYRAVFALNERALLIIDSSIALAFVDVGIWDIGRIILAGTFNFINPDVLNVPDNASFTGGFLNATENLSIVYTGTTQAINLVDVPLGFLFLNKGSSISGQTVPFYRIENSTLSVLLELGTTIGEKSFDLTDASSTVEIDMVQNSTVEDTCAIGTVGTITIFINTGNNNFPNSLVGFTGTYLLTFDESVSGLWNVIPVKTADGDCTYSDLVRCNPVGGGFAIALPPANQGIGAQIRFKNITASLNAITLTPFDGETIDSNPTLVMNTAYKSVILISDGSNWLIG